MDAQSVSDIVDHILSLPEESKIMILAPVIRDKKGEHHQVLDEVKQQTLCVYGSMALWKNYSLICSGAKSI